MNVLLIIRSFIQKHWQTCLLVLVMVVAYFWINHIQSGLATTIEKLNDSHQTEISKINQDRLVETQQHAAELKQLQDSIAKIQADYATAQQQLRARQIQEQQAIIKKYGNDVDGLANMLASRMNFAIVKSSSQ